MKRSFTSNADVEDTLNNWIPHTSNPHTLRTHYTQIISNNIFILEIQNYHEKGFGGEFRDPKENYSLYL